jgi:hypothetical protein
MVSPRLTEIRETVFMNSLVKTMNFNALMCMDESGDIIEQVLVSNLIDEKIK